MIGINLIDDAVVSARRERRRIRRWIAVVTVAAVGALVPVYSEWSRHQQLLSLRQERAGLEKEIESARSTLNELGIEITILQAQTARAGALRAKRSWSALLSVISRTLPDELWLTAIATDPAKPALGDRDLRPREQTTTAPVAGGDTVHQVVVMEAPQALRFDGYALTQVDLYDFMSELQQTNLFADVQLTRATEEPVLNAKAVRFNIQCTW